MMKYQKRTRGVTIHAPGFIESDVGHIEEVATVWEGNPNPPTPQIRLHLHDGAQVLTREQWQDLKAAVDEAWTAWEPAGGASPP